SMVRSMGQGQLGARVWITAYVADDDRSAVEGIARAYPDIFGPLDLRLLAMALEGNDDSQLLWVARGDAASVLGFAGLPPDTPVSWVVTWLAVAPHAQRRGVATALLAAVEAGV